MRVLWRQRRNYTIVPWGAWVHFVWPKPPRAFLQVIEANDADMASNRVLLLVGCGPLAVMLEEVRP